ncbi:MAG: hypothetical protein FWG79_06070 [Bacteroidales bacterium]|nr:hypothetical protein [Bacteroidales bacterium]
MTNRILILFFVFTIANFIAPVGAYCIRPHEPQTSTLTVSVLPAHNHLKYQKNDAQSTGNYDIGAALTFRTPIRNSSFVIRNFQLAIGVNYRKYHGNIDFRGMTDSVHLTESAENHNYFLYQIFNSTEEQTVTYIEPNIRLEYVQPLSGAIDLIAGVGLGYGIHYAETNEMTDGSYRRYAYFYESHNLIDLSPELNLGTYTNFLNSSQGNTFKHSLFALGEVGFRFRLSQNWQLLTLFNIQYSLFTIQAKQDQFVHHGSYSGIAGSEIPGGVRAVSMGVEVGFSYQFSKTTKRAKPSTKRPRMHGAYCPY